MLINTQVITPAVDKKLITLEEYKTEWGITGNDEDAKLTILIEGMSQHFSSLCNRSFLYEEVEDSFFFYDDLSIGYINTKMSRLWLTRQPVVSITRVLQDGEELVAGEEEDFMLADGYLMRMENGMPVKWDVRNKVKVKYFTGFNPIPADVKSAVSRLVWEKSEISDVEYGVKSRYVEGVERIEYFDSSALEGGSGILVQDVKEVVNRYRIPGMGVF